MLDMKKMTTMHYIVGILVVFAVWSALSTAWYVCGINNLCNNQAHAHEAVLEETTLADTQAPVAIAFDRSGAAGEIFVMLMIAFVLGALLGRILTASRNTSSTPSVFHMPSSPQKLALNAPRVGTPVHISEFTKSPTLASKSKPNKIRFNTSWSKPYNEKRT
jgi:hypothetical protein